MIRRIVFAVVTVAVSVQLGCAPVTYPRNGADAGTEQATALAMATMTWQQSAAATLPAVEDLVQQADAHLAAQNLDVASEKLERALRIAPDYAPAWSRMAHIALDQADPARAIRMAKRSNSHAGNAVELKLLNWQYIREASKIVGDIEGVQNASKSISILQSL